MKFKAYQYIEAGAYLTLDGEIYICLETVDDDEQTPIVMRTWVQANEDEGTLDAVDQEKMQELSAGRRVFMKNEMQ